MLILFSLINPQPVKAQSTTASISLIAQSPWVYNEEAMGIDIRVSGKMTDTSFRVELFNEIDRLGLIALKDNQLPKPIGKPLYFVVDNYLNTTGVASLEIPLSNIPTSKLGSVHPILIQLLDPNGIELDRFVTLITKVPSTTTSKPLLVALELEITGPPPLQPNGNTVLDQNTIQNLQSLTNSLNDHPSIPVTVKLPPATIVGLSRSVNLKDAQLLNDLKRASANSLQIVTSPYVTADPEAWRQTGRSDIFSDLLDHGDLVFTERLETKPNREVSILLTTAIPETLDLLHRLGSETFVITGSHLDPQPTDTNTITRLIKLPGAEGNKYPALIADPNLTNHFDNTEGAVLAVQYLIADLALLGWTNPKNPGGTVISFPKNFSYKSPITDLLFVILESAPFIELVNLSSMFDILTELDNGKTYQMWPDTVIPVSRKATDRSLAETAVAAYSALLGGPHPASSELNNLLEVTAATELNNETTELYLNAVYAEVTKILKGFSTPNNQNVRLTSRRADVPFTIENRLDSTAHVLLVLQSDGRLDFPGGSTQAAVLKPGINRIPIPVQARTSGDAKLQVTVRSPDAARLLQLESARLLIRTTRLSGVGIILFIGAAVVLAVWWLRSTRVRSN